MITALLAAAILSSAVFAFMNGKNDAPHSFAPPVRTGSLTPRIALVMSAVWTAVGALFALGWARDLSSGIDIADGTPGLLIITTAALGAAVWAAFAARVRMPSSSTHALMGGVAGASLASQSLGQDGVQIAPGFMTMIVILPLILSPLVAFALAYAVANGFTAAYRSRSAHAVHRDSRVAQSIVAVLFAMAHGLQDGQRTVFLLTAALMAAGLAPGDAETAWVTVASALLLGAGALCGSWGIGRTLTHRMTRLDPLSASIGSGTAALLLLVGGMAFHLPLSSTQLSAAGLVGAAEVSPFRPTRWRTVGQIALVWVATPLGAGALAWFLFLASSPLVAALS